MVYIPANSPIANRLPVLSRGASLGDWFWLGKAGDTQSFTSTDFALMKQMGLTYVRLPFDFSYLYDGNAANLLNADHLAKVDRAIADIQAQGLGVMMDLHSTPGEASDPNNYSGSLESPEFQTTFIEFWKSLASHLNQTTSPENTFIQPMNEPVFDDNPQAWLPIQQRIIQAIRESAPEFTIVATGAEWQSLETLIQTTPLSDPNLVYDFHFYEPFAFTHQGAEWIDSAESLLNRVPYPSTPRNIKELFKELEDAEARRTIARYGKEQWNAQKIRGMLSSGIEWAKQHNVPLICSEFGAYGDYAPADSLVRWTQDVRSALEQFGIGWATWGYIDSFGYVERQGNTSVIDRSIVQALGLTVPDAYRQTDRILGTKIGNVLVGDADNNLLMGKQGHDILNGAGSSSGRGSVDTLVGGAGRDRFIVATPTIDLYNDGKPGDGKRDYALIRDFNKAQDQIQLKDSSDRYVLNASPLANVRGTAVYLDSNRNGEWNRSDELVAIVQGSRQLNLQTGYFTYL